MITNRFGINVVKYLSYVFEWNKEDIISDIAYSEDYEKGTLEGYTLAIYLMLKSMYKNKELFMDYTCDTSMALPYLCGNLDISKSVQENTFVRGEIYQNFKVLSLRTPANMSIKFCLDVLLKSRNICNTDFAGDIKTTLKEIFDTDIIEEVTQKRIKYYLDTIGMCLDSQTYKGYYSILCLCQLVLEKLYIVDGNIDELCNSELFVIDMPYILQEFLRTALRHTMLRFNKTFPYEKDFKGKWSMRKRECHLTTSNITMDILVKFLKSSDLPHLIFDSKTNKSVIDTVIKNRYQLQTYTMEYGAKNSNVKGVLQYFVDSTATKKDLSFNSTLLKSDISDLYMFVWVFQLLPTTEPKEFEEYLYSQLIDLFEL